MIVFVDPKHGRGGGQVVLEQLLAGAISFGEVGLVMPPNGQASITIPEIVRRFTSLDQLPDFSGLVIANANASFPFVAAWTRRRRHSGARVTSLGIIHNYASDPLRKAATRVSARLLDRALVVEPGLTSVRPDALVPSWLCLPADAPVTDGPIVRTGKVKSYGRPDPTKGLHLLPEIFRRLQAAGHECSVALGTALDGHVSYALDLRRHLAPWLEDGPRTSSWIQAGDAFLIPSVAGEAACLSAQEAMARGAWVVASRLGLMPYLASRGQAVSTFPAGDTTAAVDAVRATQQMPLETFARACEESRQDITARRGLWYAETLDEIRRLHSEVGGTDERAHR